MKDKELRRRERSKKLGHTNGAFRSEGLFPEPNIHNGPPNS
jgi:hypothetical protein